MQKLLIQYLLNPLCHILEPLSGKWKNFLFLLGGFGILTTMFLQGAEALAIRYIFIFAANCAFLGLMVLGILPDHIHPVKWNKPLFFSWMAMAILRMVSVFTQNVDYFAEGFLLLVAWPVIFIILANADTTRLVHLMLQLIRVALLVFMVLSFLFSPITPGKYSGIFENTNSTSHFLAAISVTLVLSVLYSQNRKWILDAVLLGLAWTMNTYSSSRGGMLAAYVAIGCGLAMFLFSRIRDGGWKKMLRLLVSVAACSVFTVSLVYVFQLRLNLNLPYFHHETRQFYYADREEVWSYLGKEFAGYMGDAEYFGSDIFTDLAEDRFETDGQGLDKYSTGRISLWMSCIEKLNLTGHPTTEDQFYIAYKNKYFNTTHMVILQFAFESGIPMGAMYLLMNIFSGFAAIAYAWRNRSKPWALVPLMMTLSFGVLSVMESCGISLQFLGTFLYYGSMFPLITRGEAPKA